MPRRWLRPRPEATTESRPGGVSDGSAFPWSAPTSGVRSYSYKARGDSTTLRSLDLNTRPYLPATGRLRLAALYDPAIALMMRERAFRSAVIAAVLEVGPPAAVLDVGCGTGTLAIGIADAAPGTPVSGIDPDPAILERARLKAARAGAAITLSEARAEELPFPDESFDAVSMTLMLHHLRPDPKLRALREARRVLRPGGRVVIADFGRPRDLLAAAGFLAVRLLDGLAPTRDHAHGRLPALLEQAGFDAVRNDRYWRTVVGTLELLTAHRHGIRGPSEPSS